ncbi:hypothetical protein P7C70_g7323, partial [Phenoliferia sp. Uapishka_3]
MARSSASTATTSSATQDEALVPTSSAPPRRSNRGNTAAQEDLSSQQPTLKKQRLDNGKGKAVEKRSIGLGAKPAALHQWDFGEPDDLDHVEPALGERTNTLPPV